MNIQWFPGHMTKAVRMMKENIKLVDAVVYVLDARAIKSCINSTFNDIIGSKPILYVITKIDLVEKLDLDKWKNYFENNNMSYVFIDNTNNSSGKFVVNKLNELLADIVNKYKQKGVNKTLRAMVVGVPNCGKSSLINCICKSKRTVTGDKAGVTKGKQWVTVYNGLELLDTPGTLCPAFDNQIIAENIAFIGSINENILDISDLCLALIERLSTICPTKLIERYKLDSIGSSPLNTYEKIAKNRGFLLRGGDYDYERCAKAVLDDFRKQKIGKIMLDLPEEI